VKGFKKWIVYGLSFVGSLVVLVVILGMITGMALVFKSKKTGGPSIGVLNVKGVLVSSEDYLKAIRSMELDPNIKAVVVRVDSPGGAVGVAQEIYEELTKLRKLKPVVISMGSVAASGGYYLSLGGSEIYALPGTITGSIGVIMEIPDIQGLMKKLGIKTEVIKTGPYKDTGAFYRPLTEKERAYLLKKAKIVLSQFVSTIVKERKLPLAKVEKLADGRFFTGEEAKKLGLIDKLGDFWDAVDEAKKLAGLKKATLVYFPKKKGLLTRLMEEKSPVKELTSLLLKPLYLALP